MWRVPSLLGSWRVRWLLPPVVVLSPRAGAGAALSAAVACCGFSARRVLNHGGALLMLLCAWGSPWVGRGRWERIRKFQSKHRYVKFRGSARAKAKRTLQPTGGPGVLYNCGLSAARSWRPEFLQHSCLCGVRAVEALGRLLVRKGFLERKGVLENSFGDCSLQFWLFPLCGADRCVGRNVVHEPSLATLVFPGAASLLRSARRGEVPQGDVAATPLRCGKCLGSFRLLCRCAALVGLFVPSCLAACAS